ncbi:hypothetical protein SAMN05216201_10994 [Pseudomonas linyingensis]|uniref:Lipoprotein n=1 Tax=Pseudomonas linyingensis TaxID=915471 RepID=A0A1H6Z4G0_9PSED|nr:hypothetical protein SAMN05216201_10994 [Pseudomonas linyingensis]
MIRFLLAACLLLVGCAGPVPLQKGQAIDPPWGCVDLRQRGGKC